VEEVVAALDPDVRAQPVQQPVRGQLVEDHDGVHAVQGGDQTGPVGLRYHRAGRPLERAHAAVGVEAHDQAVAELAGRAQGRQVPDVQQVEAAAGGHDGTP